MPLPVVAEKIERLRPMEEGGFGPQAGMVALRPTGVPAIVELLEEMAPKLPVKQAEISKIENRAEMRMSTLRNFVQATRVVTSKSVPCSLIARWRCPISPPWRPSARRHDPPARRWLH